MLIDELYEMARDLNAPIFRLAVYEDGNLQEREILVANDCNNIYSVSKNFTATAVGILFDRGVISPDTKVRELYEPQNKELWKGIDERWHDITVAEILTQVTGYKGMFLDMDCDNIFLYGTEDFLTKALTTPFVTNPGEKFAYSDANYYLLSRVVAAAAGETLQSFAAREIFRPMEIQGWSWSTCPHGHAMGATRLFVKNMDMMKFGRLYLDKGEIYGRRILSEDFVKTATSPLVYKDEKTAYGYSFWKSNPKAAAFHCGGMYCQRIFVDPDRNLVVTWQAYDKEKKSNAMLSYLYKDTYK